MIRVAWAVARLDLARWARSPALIAASLIPAAGMSLTVLALTYAVGRQPVALVREGYGPVSERVVGILRESDGFFLRERTPEQAQRELEQQWVCAVITIPKNFDEAAREGDARLRVVINNVDLDFSDDIRRSVSEAVVAIEAPELASLGEGEEDEHAPATPATAADAELDPAADADAIPGGARNPYKVDVIETDLRRADVSFLAYQMVPVLALLALTAGALVTALSIAGDREGGRLRMMRVAPAPRAGLVAGHLLGGTLAATLLLAAITLPLAALRVLHVPSGRWPAVAALLVSTAVGSTGLGVLVGLVTHRVTTTVLLGVNAASASFLLGGAFTTIAFLPEWIQRIARLVPSYYAVEGLREALFYETMPMFARNVGVLTGTGVASVVLGAWLLSATWTRARPTRAPATRGRRDA